VVKGSSRKQVLTLVLLTCLMATGCSASGKSAGTKNPEPVSTEAVATIVDTNIAGTEATETEAAESKEESLFAVAKEINDEQKVKEIMAVIADVDWRAYNELSGQRAFELIEYLQRNSHLIHNEDFPGVLLATNGLDGALTESFAIIVGNLFTRERDLIIKDLAAMTDILQKTQVISLIAYNLSYQDVDPVIKELKQLEQDQQHSDAEKEVIAALITELNNPY